MLPETFALAWQGVRTRPLRNALTAMSLLIGVVTVVLVQGSSEVIASATVHRALLTGGPATTITATLEPTAGDLFPNARWRRLLDRTLTAVDGHAVTASSYGSVRLTVGTAPVDVDLHAVSTNVRSIRPFETTGGRWFSEGPYVAPELVVNRAAAEVVPSWEVPGELVLGDREHRVRVRLRGAVEDGIESPTAYVRESDAPQLLAAGLQPSLQSVSVTVPGESEQQLRSRISNLTALLGAASQLSDVGRTDSLSQFEDQLSTSRGLLMTIAALSLLIGALGILNIGLATLRDRSEEWAVRRALGASRRQVLVMVLVESQLVALSAAVLALGIAAATVPWTLQQLSAVPLGQAPLPWRAAALGMVASSLAAFAGAVAPAVRTSRTALSTLLR